MTKLIVVDSYNFEKLPKFKKKIDAKMWFQVRNYNYVPTETDENWVSKAQERCGREK